MILSKNKTAVNEFTFCGGVLPKTKPGTYQGKPIRLMSITPNRVFIEGLKGELLKHGDNLVDFTKFNISALNAIVYWQQQEKSGYPELILLDTYQKKISCVEVIQRFKSLNAATKILVIGDYLRHDTIEQYFYSGADGYIDQAATAMMFRYAIEVIVQEGKKFLHTPILPFNSYLVIEP